MQDATKIYRNEANGGKEKATIKGGKYSISSDWGNGFCAPSAVSASTLRYLLTATKAPADVFAAMFGDA